LRVETWKYFLGLIERPGVVSRRGIRAKCNMGFHTSIVSQKNAQSSLIRSMQDVIAKATTLLEALPYIQKFNGATFVVKYGGSFMDSNEPDVRNGVARDIVFLEA